MRRWATTRDRHTDDELLLCENGGAFNTIANVRRYPDPSSATVVKMLNEHEAWDDIIKQARKKQAEGTLTAEELNAWLAWKLQIYPTIEEKT